MFRGINDGLYRRPTRPRSFRLKNQNPSLLNERRAARGLVLCFQEMQFFGRAGGQDSAFRRWSRIDLGLDGCGYERCDKSIVAALTRLMAYVRCCDMHRDQYAAKGAFRAGDYS